ncbi:hypothetical protein [Streptosporangium sp. NPDC051022]|uniref:hypothetical protein n=1 Tax=Streptosporangium sp. NPDC051022 TaxID=3155752 RepID=UPI0034344D44
MLTSVLGFGLGALFVRVRIAGELGHLERLVPPDRRVQLVLPSARITNFQIKGQPGAEAAQPPNVLMMPMPEGNGIAELVLALRRLSRRVHILLTTDEAVSPDYKLTISIGGPSVNLESRRLVRFHPAFRLRYPEHVATHGSATYDPKRAPDGELLEDYGFVLLHSEGGRTRIVCCGVWGTGTEAAIKGLLGLRDRHLSRQLRTSRNLFLAFHTELSGLNVSEPRLIHADDGERFTTWR